MSKEDEAPSEPGASRYGNFCNYYQFHSAEARVRQMPKAVCKIGCVGSKFIALDVGCNAGDLTIELYRFLCDSYPDKEVLILAIDLDATLIKRANEKVDKPLAVTFQCLDFFSDDREKIVACYLNKHGGTLFDATFCFSVTMWIHLNHGDDGLRRFLVDVCRVSRSLLIEAQPWKCYRNASRRLRRAGVADFPLLDGLKLTGDVQEHIERLLRIECQFRKVEVSEQNDWQRELMFYERGDVA